ncbi:MAG: hypothetical protein KatS3mg038_2370 [Candidatus Kapaibacterium sp.]|nr:MAG: hypothetical protein KatS3mg038_2370 [Candidatus Kapabacteria bacterium]
MSIREAIRRVQRDPSRELGQSRRPEGYRGGTLFAIVRLGSNLGTKPPLNMAHDISSPYYLVHHRVRPIGPAPDVVASALRVGPVHIDYPPVPSNFAIGSSGYSAKRELDAWAIMAKYPPYAYVLITQDSAGHWWIVPAPMRRLIVSLPSISSLPMSFAFEHIVAQEGPGYTLARDPIITSPTSTAGQITQATFSLAANKKIVLDWIGDENKYRAIQMEC